MRSAHLATLALGSLLAAGGPAFAQATLSGPLGSPGTIEIAPDEEVVVREYIIRRRPAVTGPIVEDLGPTTTGSITVRPGSIIPADVDLEPFGDQTTQTLRGYAYFVSPNNKVVVVNPADRRVVRILDR
ncbi:MAG TPA: DUF1236 domain-containing protein [Beijerinckiaceae bacterium]|jgi:hypothetical protein